MSSCQLRGCISRLAILMVGPLCHRRFCTSLSRCSVWRHHKGLDSGGAGPHHTCHTSDRLGSAVKATAHPCPMRHDAFAQWLPYHWFVRGPPPPSLSPFLARSLPHPALSFFSRVAGSCFVSVSPLTREGDPCQRLAMMMSPACFGGIAP